MVISAGFPSLLQAFFTDRLFRQRQASPHTIAGYRDSFRLLLQFAKEQLGKAPSKLTLDDLNVSFIGDFLDDLENRRKNSARTRNIRLAAIHSFFHYVALEEPAYALLCQRVLAMPTKRHERRPIEFLNRVEIDALLAATDSSSWIGHRDRTMLLLTAQTGLRVFRVDRLELPRHRPGNRSSCPLPRKGQKTPVHTSASRNSKDAGGLVARTPRWSGRSVVSQYPWQRAQS
jgi:site-specific recombinase XerD